MTNISASSVKELREKTGAGILDCKKALLECEGDFEKAVDWLRTKGLAAAAKKAGRTAAQGVVGVKVDGNKAVLIELNSETDFVARNEQFQRAAADILNTALTCFTDSLDTLKSQSLASGKTVDEAITNLIAVIGENMQLRRLATLSVGKGFIGHYIHNLISPGLGTIGVVVALESNANATELAPLAKQIAMHIAAAKPLALQESDIDASLVEREKAIFSEQAKASGKPQAIIDKMIDGRIKKYYEEVVLLSQPYMFDTKVTVQEWVNAAAKEMGAPVSVSGFRLFVLGDGVEKSDEE